MTITPKQADTLRLIRRYIGKHGFSPTFQNIADRFRVTKVTVHEHVHALAALGAITITPRRWRSIRLCGKPGTCPLCKQKTRESK